MELDDEETALLKRTLYKKYKKDSIEIDNCLKEHYSELIHTIATEKHDEICPVCPNICDRTSTSLFLYLGSSILDHATHKQMWDTWKSFNCEILDSTVLRKVYFKWLKKVDTVKTVIDDATHDYYLELLDYENKQ